MVGFYKGLLPNLLRVVPSTCVTFLVYENVRWALPRTFGDDHAGGDAEVPNKAKERKSTL